MDGKKKKGWIGSASSGGGEQVQMDKKKKIRVVHMSFDAVPVQKATTKIGTLR